MFELSPQATRTRGAVDVGRRIDAQTMISGDRIHQGVLSIQISIETYPENTKTTSSNDISLFEPEKNTRNHGNERNEDPTTGGIPSL